MKRLLFITLALAVFLSCVICAHSEGLDDWECPVCGSVGNWNFCPNDGTPRPETGNTVDWECPVCGTVGSWNFCPNDGTPRPDADDSVAAYMNQNELPYFSDLYPGYDVRLHALDGDDRAYTFTGPGRNYLSSGGYQPRKQKSITAYFIEDDWVFAYLQYATVEDRYLYFKKSAFDHMNEHIPTVEFLDYYDGIIVSEAVPSWGPSSQFNLLTQNVVPAGTPIRAYFQENGYVYAQFNTEKGTMRMWIPAEYVDVPDMIIEETNESEMQTGTSAWGLPVTATIIDSETYNAEDDKGESVNPDNKKEEPANPDNNIISPDPNGGDPVNPNNNGEDPVNPNNNGEDPILPGWLVAPGDDDIP